MSDLLSQPPVPACLKGLNQAQREAAETTEGPVLVLAGAGTGKTRVLIARFAHIVTQGKARPWEIMAVTFTNKAANEMKARAAGFLPQAEGDWWVGTFHAIGARILRRHADVLGLGSDFTILDGDDQTRLVRQLVQAREIDEKRWPAKLVLGVIQRWKDMGLSPENVPDSENSEVADGHVLELYGEYQARLKSLNAVDFGDLLLHCLTLFRERADILQGYQDKFRYILVDEYQDTNVAQYLWLRLLAQGRGNICCVGDDDQSIYSWRGAEVGNILKFEKDFPGAKVVRLECNYRSTPHILAAASAIIANNESRLGKSLWTELKDGEKVCLRGLWDSPQEAAFVTGKIETLHAGGHSLGQMAVLVRTGAQTREFEEKLIEKVIPYRVIGGQRFYERMEIRDAVAYLRAITRTEDDLAFERIFNLPKRGLGKATLQILQKLSRDEGIPLASAARRVLEADTIKPRARRALADFVSDLAGWRSMGETISPAKLADLVLDQSGYREMWRNSKLPDAPGRLENLRELVVALEDFNGLGEFLEHVSLVMENEATGTNERVSLMTMHAAKGLEFDTVFLAGWEEGLFPHQRALDESGESGLEEERRLAYVGLTRARHLAVVSFAASRCIFGRWQGSLPSRFIDELPRENIDQEIDPGLYRRGGSERNPGPGLREERSGFKTARTRHPGVDSGKSPFDAGKRVFHQKFGYGYVIWRNGEKLEIAFDKAGTKKIMKNFVKAI